MAYCSSYSLRQPTCYKNLFDTDRAWGRCHAWTRVNPIWLTPANLRSNCSRQSSKEEYSRSHHRGRGTVVGYGEGVALQLDLMYALDSCSKQRDGMG